MTPTKKKNESKKNNEKGNEISEKYSMKSRYFFIIYFDLFTEKKNLKSAP